MQRHLIAAMVSVPVLAAAMPATATEDIQNLRVLYAGDLDDERTEDFRVFLAEEFVEVGVTSFEDFTPEEADGYDVVVFDWGRIYFQDEGRLDIPDAPALPADFNRPMVLIGGAGIRVAESRNAKLDWL